MRNSRSVYAIRRLGTSRRDPRLGQALPEPRLSVVVSALLGLAILTGLPATAQATEYEFDTVCADVYITYFTEQRFGRLAGPATIEVNWETNPGEADDDDLDGLDEVATELTNLRLSGTTPEGQLNFTLQAAPPSTGEIEERINSTPGTLDVQPFAGSGTADSAFDLYITNLQGGASNSTPATVLALHGSWPPAPGEIYVGDYGSGFLQGINLAPFVFLNRVELDFAPDALDFGDAPVAPYDPPENPYGYPTLLADDGAAHGGDGTLRLGALRDRECDGQPNAAATGDDGNTGPEFIPADEDGVSFVSPLALEVLPGSTGIQVTASAAGKLDAWVDFNGDGDWNDPGEQIFTSAALAAGVNDLDMPVSADVELGCATFGRFRLSSAGGLAPTGTAADGEVEDYQIEFGAATDVDLFNRVLGGSQTFIASSSITAGGAFTTFPDLIVESGAEITLHAGSTVVFKDGLLVDNDATLTVEVGPLPDGCVP